MPEGVEISRRGFLKGALAAVATVVIDGACNRPDREETREKKKDPASTTIEQLQSIESGSPEMSSRFLGEEVEMLMRNVGKKEVKRLVLEELARIEKGEAAKLLKIRFSNSQKQMEKYFQPFFDNKEKIMEAIEAADPEKKVPRAVIYGLIGMESGGRNKAINQDSGAGGIFQMTAETARSLDLEVNKEKDERLDYVKSSKAVVKYLLTLHTRFGEQWGLALAAYAGGPNRLEDRIRQKFGLKKEELTPELLEKKLINIVTLYSKKFKFLGKKHSVQYPFGAQAMAQWMEELTDQKKDNSEEGKKVLAEK